MDLHFGKTDRIWQVYWIFHCSAPTAFALCCWMPYINDSPSPAGKKNYAPPYETLHRRWLSNLVEGIQFPSLKGYFKWFLAAMRIELIDVTATAGQLLSRCCSSCQPTAAAFIFILLDPFRLFIVCFSILSPLTLLFLIPFIHKRPPHACFLLPCVLLAQNLMESFRQSPDNFLPNLFSSNSPP